MITTPLLTPAEVKTLTYSDANINDNHLYDPIILQQEVHFSSVYGEPLVNDLIVKKIGGTLSLIEQTFLAMIEKGLSYWAMSQAAPLVQYKLKNNGVTVLLPDQTKEISPKDLQVVVDGYVSQGNMYLTAANRYFEDNKIEFTAYVESDKTIDSTKPSLLKGNSFYMPERNYAKYTR